MDVRIAAALVTLEAKWPGVVQKAALVLAYRTMWERAA